MAAPQRCLSPKKKFENVLLRVREELINFKESLKLFLTNNKVPEHLYERFNVFFIVIKKIFSY